MNSVFTLLLAEKVRRFLHQSQVWVRHGRPRALLHFFDQVHLLSTSVFCQKPFRSLGRNDRLSGYWRLRESIPSVRSLDLFLIEIRWASTVGTFLVSDHFSSLQSLVRTCVEVDGVQVRWLLGSLAGSQVSFAATVDHILNRDHSSLVARKVRFLVLLDSGDGR